METIENQQKQIHENQIELDRMNNEIEEIRQKQKDLEIEKENYKESLRAENERILKGMRHNNEARIQKELAKRLAKQSVDIKEFNEYLRQKEQAERQRHNAEIQQRMMSLESDMETDDELYPAEKPRNA